MGVGRFLKRITTIPSKGPLSGLRKVFGENMLDELGTVGGFLVGGPAGAAAGRGLGNFVHTQNVGKGLRAGAEGYALGSGAQMLGVPGGGSLGFGGGGAAATSAPSMASAPAGVTQVSTAAPSAVPSVAPQAAQAGRFAQAGKFLSGNADAIGLGLQGVGMYAGAQAQGEQARIDDERLGMEKDDRARLYRERDQNGLAGDAFLARLLAAPLYQRNPAAMNVPYQFNG